MSRFEIWPNFFIVGVAKCGTTSLSAWLSQHPQVFISPIKEPRYFARDLVHPIVQHVVQTKEEYLELFINGKDFPARGEASTSYFTHYDKVTERIRNVVPEARIIIILRDPVERAYSAYLMLVRKGVETMPFYDAIMHSPFSSWYIQSYTEPTRKYMQSFGSHNVLVLMFEELKNRPLDLLKNVARFLEIDEFPMEGISTTVENPGGIPRGKMSRRLLMMRRKLPVRQLPMPVGIKSLARKLLLGPKPAIDTRSTEYLRPIFAEDINNLESLLGRPLPDLRKGW